MARYSRFNLRASKEVNKLSVALKHLLPKGKIIAVHNNESYSLHDYLPGHHLESDARLLHVEKKNYYRNFFLVTKNYIAMFSHKFNNQCFFT